MDGKRPFADDLYRPRPCGNAKGMRKRRGLVERQRRALEMWIGNIDRRSAKQALLGPHCLHQSPGSENLDHSLEVIGKYVETHLRTDFLQCLREEMRAAHP